MLRRTLLVTAVALAATAAGAMAFASDSVRFGLNWVDRTRWLGRGFTAVPAANGKSDNAAAGVLGQVGDSTSGKFCRFPGVSGETPHVAARHPADSVSSDSVLLGGQTVVPGATTPAICTGEAPSPLLSPGIR